jgi:transposase
MARVLPAQRVEAWRRVGGAKQVEQTPQDVGRGRGSLHREKRGIQKTRSPLPHIVRQEDTSTAHRPRLGWQAFVPKAGHTRRSWQEAVWCSRTAYRVERIFHRLKSRRPLAPLLVKLNEHIEARTYLLTLGVRG